jgi:hypothetical protein
MVFAQIASRHSTFKGPLECCSIREGHDMDQSYLDMLSELRYAMDEAFGKSDRVIAAIVALQRAGKGVKIAIDTALVDIPVPGAHSPSTEDHSILGGQLILNATDLLFLRGLKISVESGSAGVSSRA